MIYSKCWKKKKKANQKYFTKLNCPSEMKIKTFPKKTKKNRWGYSSSLKVPYKKRWKVVNYQHENTQNNGKGKHRVRYKTV